MKCLNIFVVVLAIQFAAVEPIGGGLLGGVGGLGNVGNTLTQATGGLSNLNSITNSLSSATSLPTTLVQTVPKTVTSITAVTSQVTQVASTLSTLSSTASSLPATLTKFSTIVSSAFTTATQAVSEASVVLNQGTTLTDAITKVQQSTETLIRQISSPTVNHTIVQQSVTHVVTSIQNFIYVAKTYVTVASKSLTNSSPLQVTTAVAKIIASTQSVLEIANSSISTVQTLTQTTSTTTVVKTTLIQVKEIVQTFTTQISNPDAIPNLLGSLEGITSAFPGGLGSLVDPSQIQDPLNSINSGQGNEDPGTVLQNQGDPNSLIDDLNRYGPGSPGIGLQNQGDGPTDNTFGDPNLGSNLNGIGNLETGPQNQGNDPFGNQFGYPGAGSQNQDIGPNNIGFYPYGNGIQYPVDPLQNQGYPIDLNGNNRGPLTGSPSFGGPNSLIDGPEGSNFLNPGVPNGIGYPVDALQNQGYPIDPNGNYRGPFSGSPNFGAPNSLIDGPDGNNFANPGVPNFLNNGLPPVVSHYQGDPSIQNIGSNLPDGQNHNFYNYPVVVAQSDYQYGPVFQTYNNGNQNPSQTGYFVSPSGTQQNFGPQVNNLAGSYEPYGLSGNQDPNNRLDPLDNFSNYQGVVNQGLSLSSDPQSLDGLSGPAGNQDISLLPTSERIFSNLDGQNSSPQINYPAYGYNQFPSQLPGSYPFAGPTTYPVAAPNFGLTGFPNSIYPGTNSPINIFRNYEIALAKIFSQILQIISSLPGGATDQLIFSVRRVYTTIHTLMLFVSQLSGSSATSSYSVDIIFNIINELSSDLQNFARVVQPVLANQGCSSPLLTALRLTTAVAGITVNQVQQLTQQIDSGGSNFSLQISINRVLLYLINAYGQLYPSTYKGLLDQPNGVNQLFNLLSRNTSYKAIHHDISHSYLQIIQSIIQQASQSVQQTNSNYNSLANILQSLPLSPDQANQITSLLTQMYGNLNTVGYRLQSVSNILNYISEYGQTGNYNQYNTVLLSKSSSSARTIINSDGTSNASASSSATSYAQVVSYAGTFSQNLLNFSGYPSLSS